MFNCFSHLNLLWRAKREGQNTLRLFPLKVEINTNKYLFNTQFINCLMISYLSHVAESNKTERNNHSVVKVLLFVVNTMFWGFHQIDKISYFFLCLHFCCISRWEAGVHRPLSENWQRGFLEGLRVREVTGKTLFIIVCRNNCFNLKVICSSTLYWVCIVDLNLRLKLFKNSR